ncbi:MAG: hypothetical protein ACKVOM_05880 [Ferruginibacter sp.]
MTATYSLLKSEFNAEFVEKVKQMFKGERISILIEEEIDETERIQNNPALLNKILEASNHLNADDGNIIRFESNEFIEKFNS